MKPAIRKRLVAAGLTTRIVEVPANVRTPVRRGRRARRIVAVALLLVCALIWCSPLVLLVTTSLRTADDFITRGPLAFPSAITFKNFTNAWATGGFPTAYRNSLLITAVKVPIGVLLSALLAYAVVKLHLVFRRTVLFLIFVGLTIPIYITIVPVFVMLRAGGLIDNPLGLLGPYLAFGIPFEVLILIAFLRSLPDSIVEAARIDGASELRIFFQIVAPLSAPALITVAILDAVGTWNELLFALIILNSEDKQTLPLGLLNFQGQFANDNTGLAAGILVATIPIVVAYVFFQKWIVSGLTAGATQG